MRSVFTASAREILRAFALSCLDSMLHHATVEDLDSMLKVLGEADPLTAARVKEYVGGV